MAESELKAVPRAKFATQALSAASSGGLQPKKISAHFPGGIGSDDMDVGSTVNVQVDYAFADSPTEGGYQGCVFGGTGFAG